MDTVEKQRLELQRCLDSVKTQAERNKLGQFPTPTALAADILECAKTLVSTFADEHSTQIRFLDPAFGTGAFYSALLRSFSHVTKAWGYEIDPHYDRKVAELWAETPLKFSIADFTRVPPPTTDDNRANLLVCNPPYVRHHHLSVDEKSRLQQLAKQITGIRLSGLSGLYCYFLLISHGWMAKDGLAGWLIPSEFMDVNYGKQVKQYLLQHVTLLRVHRFDPGDMQFEDALVSTAVIWFKKTKPPAGHKVEFSYGGGLTKPRIRSHISMDALWQATKWTKFPQASKVTLSKSRLSDFFTIRRGLVTGANKFFILAPDQIVKRKLPNKFLIPILPSPRYLGTSEIEADKDGNPVIDPQLFLINCNLPEKDVQAQYPSLWKYLQSGVQRGIDKRYLCRHRSPWYSQENRPSSPFLCTYMGRQTAGNGKPFRFILNHSKATAPNVYLMLYPKPALNRELENNPRLFKAVWQVLSEIPMDILMNEGRVYGGGLYKIEPSELANAPADGILDVLPNLADNVKIQLSLF